MDSDSNICQKSDNSQKFLPQITDELKLSIDEILKDYEEKYEINIFYASDTGSRAYGVSVPTSDFDVNAFFIPNYREYLKIVRKSPPIISKQGLKFSSGNQTYEMDLILWDIQDWLRDKIEKNNLGFDYVLFSPIVYRNYQPEIFQQIKSIIDPPFYYFWGKLKNNLDICNKELKKDGTQNKKIMNTLIYSLNYLYCRVFNEFPDFNIFLLIEKIKTNTDKLKLHLNEEEISNLNECFLFIEECYEEKKKGRKSLRKDIPEIVSKLNSLFDNKFNGKRDKLSINNPWTSEFAQNIFNQLLSIYKNK
jgi:predicted nucleotidyltransferase